ncbi:MAG: metallophosphoesterase [Sulfurimonas sp.]|jgi:serine/threonine protein phosphatase 1
MNHYVIGDVHGHYQTLISLVEKLPDDARLVFVGDLIDRGPQSAEVVRFLRKNNHLCVMGNHEDLMAYYGQFVLNAYKNDKPIGICNEWGSNGGVETLISYGIAIMDGENLLQVKGCEEALRQFEDDMEWMKNLPLYIELPMEHSFEKAVVVSHAPIADMWEMRSDAEKAEVFRHKILTNRRDPSGNTSIFNIFGHSPVRWRAEVTPYFVNVDTGCYMGKNGYNRLSAYCVESGEIIEQEYVR